MRNSDSLLTTLPSAIPGLGNCGQMEFSNIYSKSNLVNGFESEIEKVWEDRYGKIAYADKELALITLLNS